MTAQRAALALFAPDNASVFEAISDALVTAATYSEAGFRFAEVKDAKGLAYAIRSASAALLSAAALIEEVRPSQQGGRRA